MSQVSTRSRPATAARRNTFLMMIALGVIILAGGLVLALRGSGDPAPALAVAQKPAAR